MRLGGKTSGRDVKAKQLGAPKGTENDRNCQRWMRLDVKTTGGWNDSGGAGVCRVGV